MAISGFLADSLATLTAAGVACVALLWAAKRLGPVKSGGALRLEGELALGPRRSVYLVRAGEKVFVVGASEGGLTALGELDGATVPRREERQPSDFSAILARLGRTQPAKPTTEPVPETPSREEL